MYFFYFDQNFYINLVTQQDSLNFTMESKLLQYCNQSLISKISQELLISYFLPQLLFILIKRQNIFTFTFHTDFIFWMQFGNSFGYAGRFLTFLCLVLVVANLHTLKLWLTVYIRTESSKNAFYNSWTPKLIFFNGKNVETFR